MSRRLLLGGLPTALCALLAFAAPAHAIYGPAAGGLGAEIVSVDNASDEQADAPTTDADISANGQYVVFQTKATNFFENDGVAGGDPEPPGTLREGGHLPLRPRHRRTGARRRRHRGAAERQGRMRPGECDLPWRREPVGQRRTDATSPSPPRQQLVPQDTNENVDVYVRDMDVPLTADRTQSGAYTLVSAKNGGEEPATYDDSS